MRKIIKLNNVEIDTYLIDMGQANLIIAKAPKGFLMCGYLDISVAQKLHDAACVVSGVKTIEELLEKPVVKLTSQAERLGIDLGMSGRQALERMI